MLLYHNYKSASLSKVHMISKLGRWPDVTSLLKTQSKKKKGMQKKRKMKMKYQNQTSSQNLFNWKWEKKYKREYFICKEMKIIQKKKRKAIKILLFFWNSHFPIAQTLSLYSLYFFLCYQFYQSYQHAWN